MKPKLDYTVILPTENEIQKSILDYLRTRQYHCWRNNTGMHRAMYGDKERFVRFGQVGSGDILGMTRAGRFFSIEVKRPGKKPTSEQLDFIKKVHENNGLAFVASSIDDVINAGL